jgi:hypothetical protein
MELFIIVLKASRINKVNELPLGRIVPENPTLIPGGNNFGSGFAYLAAEL